MHIVHLYDGHEKVYRGRGSVPGVVWNIARETARLGHDVTIIERQWNGLSSEAYHEGVAFRRLDLATGSDDPWERIPYETVRSPTGIARLVGDRTNLAVQALRQLRRLDYDILHVHLPFAANVITTVAPWLRDDMVYTAHLGELRLDALAEDESPGETDGGISVPSVVQRFSPDVLLARHVARTTVLNERIQSVFVKRGVNPESVEVVPNGVDIERFAAPAPETVEAVTRKYGFDAGTNLLFVGTVMPRKGVLELIRALSTVHKSHSDIQLVIAGDTDVDPGYVGDVRTLIQNRGLNSTVEMVGFVAAEELPALYAAADLFVMPSLEEGFGMTAIEAMAAGTPVVGTRVGGIPDVIEEGTHGFIIPPGDEQAIATKLQALIEDPDEQARLGANAQRRAKEYSWHRIAEQFEIIYQEVSS